MFSIDQLKPVDYLLIGHLTIDQTPDGPQVGGTVCYAALMARALGLKVGIVTSWGGEVPLGPLSDIPIANFPTDKSSTFENLYTPSGRVQTVHHVAPRLDFYQVPEPWRKASIVHLGPVAQEVEPAIVRNFPDSLLVGVTPQGWLRNWDQDGIVHTTEWPEATFVMGRVDAAVISVEDLEYDEDRIDEMAAICRVLAVTEGDQGVRLYWNGDVRRFRPPEVPVVNATGAGDIFAAAFFERLFSTNDPWEAARFATQLSAISVTRSGAASIPTPAEINASMLEVF